MGGNARAATPPNPPTNLFWSNESKASLTFSWTPSPSPGVVDYLVSSPSGGPPPTIVDGGNASTTTIDGLTCGTSYSFSLVAIDSSGNTSSPAYVSGTTSACDADLAVVSNTPSVSQAQTGQDVTFTVVATNYGPDPVDLWVNTGKVVDGLNFVASATCQPGTGADGTQCEYGFITYPSQTITTTIVLQVQATAGQFASDAACVFGAGNGSISGLVNDPNPGNDCKIATVQVISAGPQPPPSSSPPVNQTVPKIVGVPVIGNALIESNGGWTNSPTSFRYQWQRCNNVGGACASIGGATGQIYTPSWMDLGDTLRVQEWATNTTGTGGPADSAVTAAVQAPPGPPLPQPGPPVPSPGLPPVPGSPPVASPVIAPAQIRAQLFDQLAPTGKGSTIAALLANRGYTFWFHALGGGRVVISWYYLPSGATLSRATLRPVLVATGKATFLKAGPAKLTIKLTPAGRRMLTAAKRLKLTARGTYTHVGHPSVTARKRFTLSRR